MPPRRRRMVGANAFTDFFTQTIPSFARRAGDMVVDRLKKPSTYLGLAGQIPSPLAPVFKGASIITGLAGHGRKRKRRAGAPKKKKQAGGKRKRVARKK